MNLVAHLIIQFHVANQCFDIFRLFNHQTPMKKRKEKPAVPIQLRATLPQSPRPTFRRKRSNRTNFPWTESTPSSTPWRKVVCRWAFFRFPMRAFILNIVFLLFAQDSYVIAFLAVVEQHCKQNHFLTRVDFSFEHPVEEIGRVLFAVLLKHLGLGYILIPILDACK